MLARRPHLVNNLRHALISGDVALEIIDWTLELDAPDGSRARLAGTTANVVRRDEHGSWRLAVLNPTGTAV